MLVIYCSEQLDGIAAAAILKRYARLKGIDCRIGGFLNYSTIEQNFDEMAAMQGQLLAILDFSPEQINNFEAKLRRITARNKIIYWNSHHPYDATTLEMMKRYISTVDFSGKLKNVHAFEQRTCSAELACKKFLPLDPVAKALGAIAHDMEFWQRKDERSIKLTDLISSGFDRRELAEVLSRGVLWSERFEQLRAEYLQKKEKAFEDLLKRMQIKQYLTHKFGFSIAPSVLNSADAGQKMLDSHAALDVAVIIYRNGKISFRRRDGTSIDLSKIAKLFNGGGHSYAAGGTLPEFKNITLENFEHVLFFIDRKLKDWFVK